MGTLWAVGHAPGRKFDAEDARLLASLARFAAAAHQAVAALDAAEGGRRELERRAEERARAEAALRESEERHRLILGSALDYAIFTSDAEGVITAWPPGAQAVLGGVAEEMIGRNVAATFVSEDRERGEPEKERAEAREKGHAPNVRWHQRIDGSRVFIEGSARPLRDAKGGTIGFLKVGRDVTEQRRVQQALRASEELFRSFAENSADVLWIVDAATGRLEYLSPAFERVWGEPRDAVVAALGRWAELVHPDDHERALQGLPRLLLGEVASFVAEYRILRPADGAVRWIRDAGFPIRDPARGAVRRVGGIAQDVTESREAADRARASEERLRALVEGIPQLVWRAADGGEWTWSSPQWHAATGLCGERSRGLGWLAALHPDDREAATAAWGRAGATGAFAAEYRVRRLPEGRYRWFQSRATPVRDGQGRIVEWLGTSTDVDDLRSLQERQRLLLAELQHRVRNTLGVVRSIARRTAAASATVDDHATHLDGRLAAFARTQAMVTRDPAGGVDLGGLVAEELLACVARDGEQVRVEGPPLRLRPKAAEDLGLAVHELATNALKYGALADPRGRVEVAWRVESDGAAAAPLLRFSWTETGAPAAPPSTARRRGFGTELLERTLAYELKARTRLAFEPEGLRCTIEIPLTPRIAVGTGDA